MRGRGHVSRASTEEDPCTMTWRWMPLKGMKVSQSRLTAQSLLHTCPPLPPSLGCLSHGCSSPYQVHRRHALTANHAPPPLLHRFSFTPHSCTASVIHATPHPPLFHRFSLSRHPPLLHRFIDLLVTLLIWGVLVTLLTC